MRPAARSCSRPGRPCSSTATGSSCAASSRRSRAATSPPRPSIDVSQGGKRIDTLRPSARTYLDSGEPTKQIAIRPLLRTGEDLYLVFDGSPRPGVVTIKAFLNPLVNLLWLSAIVLVLGFAIAIWPDPRAAARLARRTNEAFARAR